MTFREFAVAIRWPGEHSAHQAEQPACAIQRSAGRHQGVPLDEFRFNEPMPDALIILQGELIEDYLGWRLAYSRAKVTMRKAMEHATHCTGLTSRTILREACDERSFEQIEELLMAYPDHAIEFSVFGVNVGDQHRNTIIWEVRKY